MAFKFIVFLAFVTLSCAGIVPGPQTVQQKGQTAYGKQPESQSAANPNYKFSYAVSDEHTGDVKSQVESRDGDVVHGEYSLVDADGYKRVVHYSADQEHGFMAYVKREPLNYASKAAASSVPKSTPVVHTAPASIKPAPTLQKSAPSTYSAAPTQTTYIRQSDVKPAHASYNSQPFNKKSPAAYSSQPSAKSAQGSYVNKPLFKPVVPAIPKSKSPSSYGR